MISKRFTLAVCLLLISALTASCGSSSSTSTKALDSSYTPQKSLAGAVTAILNAQKENNPTASFALLDPDARSKYKDVADWTSRLNELPAITSFDLSSAKDSTQVALVKHQPSIDPFKGLSAAQERQSWVGHKFTSGWLLDADPETDPVLPADAKATAAVKAWTEAVQACDKTRAHDFQAIDTLIASTTPALCQVPGVVIASDPTPLVEGPDSANIVDQYSTDALVWARTVAVTGPASFHVVVAPIGDDWKVLALY